MTSQLRPRRLRLIGCLFALFLTDADVASAGQLLAGAAKVDVTDYDAGPVSSPMYVKALVLESDTTTLTIVTVDAVAIGELGRIKNDYLPKVRTRIEAEVGIPSANVLVNASHCHGMILPNIEDQTLQAVKQAKEKLVPVTVGVGIGHEDRVQANRRLKLKDGREIDVRHAYSMPPDEEVAEVGPIDPQIGVLRLDRLDGRVLAVLYNFACHPIQGVPSGANTADMTGFASQVIEDNLDEGVVALFIQGCGGDVNPVFYKDADHPRDAEPLGNLLGLSTLRAVRTISTREDDRLTVSSETITLPRADHTDRIASMEAERDRLLASLKGTTLNLKSFLPLIVKYNLAGEFPSYYSQRYLHEKRLGRNDLEHLDAENRRNMEAYIANIQTMESLTRLQTNLRLLKKHQASLIASGKRTIDVELLGVRIGDFVLTTFPGELTVPIGLNIKERSPHEPTFVAGYTNGYIYYSPTAEQLLNVGGAQEDSDCLLAPEWQAIYETRAVSLLGGL